MKSTEEHQEHVPSLGVSIDKGGNDRHLATRLNIDESKGLDNEFISVQ